MSKKIRVTIALGNTGDFQDASVPNYRQHDDLRL